MPITETYKLAAVKIGDFVCDQITAQSISVDLQQFIAADTAGIYNTAASVDLETIRLQFTTEKVGSALANIPFLGFKPAALSPVVAYFAKQLNGGVLDTTGVSFTFESGLVLFRSLEASARSLANASFEFIATSSDGSTAPFTKATGVAIPSAGAVEMYTVGGAGIRSFSIDTGIEEALDADGGDSYPTFVSIKRVAPKVQATKVAMGTLGTTALTSLQLDDCPDGGRRGSSPITFSFAKELAYVSSIGGEQTETQYESNLLYNGSTAPIAITGLPAA